MTKIPNSKRLASLLLFLLVLGCSIGPGERSAPHTYLLDPELSIRNFVATPERTVSITLLVSAPRARPAFDTPRMAYLLRAHEVSYYAFNQWADTPSRMLTGLLVQAMERTGLWRAVVQAPTMMRADYRLDCDNLVLEQQFFSHSRVRLTLRAQLIDIKRQIVTDARDFEVFENAPSDDAYGGVIAANRAAAKLLEEMAAWVRAVIMDSVREAG